MIGAVIGVPALVIVGIAWFIRLPTLVYMLFPIVLVAYFLTIPGRVLAWAMRGPQSDQMAITDPFQSERVPQSTRSGSVLQLAPFIPIGVLFVVSWFAIPLAVFVALLVAVGIGVGYYVGALVRVEKRIQHRVVAERYPAPWWLTSVPPLKHLRNALCAFLAIVILIALHFLPVAGIALVVGIAIGPFLSGPLARYWLLTLCPD
jgi:hypothetical protein